MAQTKLTETEIDDLARAALDAACKAIQDKMGVQTGDVAGLYFSGETEDEVLDHFQAYIRMELMYLPDEPDHQSEIDAKVATHERAAQEQA